MEPNLPVLILSMHPSDQYALRVLRAGASGYLTKETAPGELVHAIKHSFRGQKYLSPEVAELLAG
ncbi:response regulator, partial [Escherichia coli]|nr:response regulator [Escherichia coli]